MAQRPHKPQASSQPALVGEEAILAQVSRALDLIDQNKVKEAESICRRLLQKHPDHPHATRVLANALLLQRMLPQALHYLDRCGEIAPAGDAMYLAVVARMRRQVMPDEATRDLFKRALDIDPTNVDAWLGYTDILLMCGNYPESRDASHEAMKYAPGHPDIIHNRCVALQMLGRAEESFEESERLVRMHPEYPPGRLIRASTAMHAGLGSGEQIRDDTRAYWVKRGARKGMGKPITPERMARAVEAARHGQLRVGLLSPDLREHSVSYFVEPLLSAWNRDRVYSACYVTVGHEDKVTQRLMSKASAWRLMALSSIGMVSEALRNDDIHVAIDLAGHTAGSAIGSLAFEQAFLQVTFCGWPSTSGLDAIDVRIVDSHTDPAGPEPYDAQSHATERLVRIDPCFLCYRPPEDAPMVVAGPAERGEPITFGSFNALKKVSRAALEAWARVLRDVPGSRFVVKTRALEDASTREDLMKRMEDLGVDRARLELLSPTKTTREHLALYAKMDVALDTFPYAGTTTTCESLLMGVPVVSRVGQYHAGRVGLSLLTNVGLGHLCASDIDGYVRIAEELAADRAGLIAMRRNLRAQLLGSALCDQEAYAARFERALRDAVIEKAQRTGVA